MVRVPLRVVCHAILRVDLVPAHVQRLRWDMEQRCEERGARLLDFVVDFGAAKRRADDYPSLSYLRNGRADVLLVVRVPVFDSRQSGDLLESLAMPDGQAVAWLTVPQLRRLGLLPPAVDVPGLALQRATELRGKRFPFAAIARWLDTEGYAPDNGSREHWTGADVAKLLRRAEVSMRTSTLDGGSCESAGLR
ncbi:MAG: hypothetical protein JNJ46_05550 [Myxococcales bacterium]|nr:hypothetical protein [Myxococcales bacterium]